MSSEYAAIQQMQLQGRKPGVMGGDEFRKHAFAVMEHAEAQDYHDKVHAGDGRRAVFSPFLGEFGHLLMHHVRLVYFSTAIEKVVCTSPGMESLYPDATSFFYDWEHPLNDKLREGTDRCLRDWPDVRARFPGYTLVQSGGLTMPQERRCVRPGERIPFKPKCRGLYADVCIGTRSRGLLPENNWQGCHSIAAALRARGLTYATIAHPSVGYHLDGEACMSGDYPDIDAAIELIQNCKFYFSQDSGCAHLASTVGCDMAVLEVPAHWTAPDGSTVEKRSFVERMQSANPGRTVQPIPQGLWNDIPSVTAMVMAKIDSIL